jgi:putative toxin-antitoxin system antitoxin component (TIGR02293 family)
MTTAVLTKKGPGGIATVQQQIDRIRGGLSFRAAENLQKALSMPMEKLAIILGLSRATLHRRKVQGKLGQAESEKLVRYQQLLKKASEVFGNADEARLWLTHPQPGLGNAVPIDFARSEIGAREVENLLGRIEYGVYS